MMKQILAASAAVAAVAAFSAPAFAADSATVNIAGSVGAVCSIGNVTTTTYNVGDISDGNGGLSTAATTGLSNIHLGTWFCNGAGSKATLTATKFANPVANPDSANFTNAVDYQATVSVGSVTQTIDTVTGINFNNVPVGIFYVSDLTPTNVHAVSIGAKKLIAGNYLATITVILTPGV
jgi:hypothetical protein